MPDGTQAKTTTKSPSSTKATHGSKSSMREDTGSQHHKVDSKHDTSAHSGKGGDGRWALDEWLKQKPRDEPWNAFAGRRG